MRKTEHERGDEVEEEGGGGVEKWSVGREAHKLNRAISGDQQ